MPDSDAMDSQRCLSSYDGDVTLSPGGGEGGGEADMDGTEEKTMENDDECARLKHSSSSGPSSRFDKGAASGDSTRRHSQSGDHYSSPITASLTLDINAAVATTTVTSGSNDSAPCIFKVPESPATSCKLGSGGGGAIARGRKTSLTGISTGSNGSSSSSGVSSMTSEQFDAAVAASSLGGKGDATSCSTLDLVAQRRTTGSSSSFSVEEEDANDVYSRYDLPISVILCGKV